MSIEVALSKLRSAQICHPNAVQFLIDEAIAAIQQAEAKTGEPVGEVKWAANVPNSIREVVFYGGLTPPVGTKLYTHPAPGVPDGYVLVPISDLEDAEESIDDYRNGLGFGATDTSILDRLGALITATQAQKGQP